MTKETTEISLTGVLYCIQRDNSLAYQFRQKESPASTMSLTVEIAEPHEGISGLIYDNAKITVIIEVDSEAEYVGSIPE